MNYNSCLLGTIVHYMGKNEEIELEDVLHSIVETFNWYTDSDTKIEKIDEIITPSFLYLKG